MSCRSAPRRGAFRHSPPTWRDGKIYGRGSTRYERRRCGDRRGGGRACAASCTERRAWCWSSRRARSAAARARTSWPLRTACWAKPAHWSLPSRPPTARSTAIRACSGSRAARRASPRMARCPSRATTRSIRRRASSASWKRLKLDDGRALTGGLPTLNVGWFHGGMNINSIPDEAKFGLDIRMVPGLSDTEVLAQARRDRRRGCDLHPDGLFARPSTPIRRSMDRRGPRDVAEITGERHAPGIATYFTDAEALARGYGHPPTIILGPGEPRHGAPDRRVSATSAASKRPAPASPKSRAAGAASKRPQRVSGISEAPRVCRDHCGAHCRQGAEQSSAPMPDSSTVLEK